MPGRRKDQHTRRALRRALLAAVAAIGLAATAPVAAPTAAAPGAKSSQRTNAVRTLEAITIEGEIAVPQVLFITSRDYRRFRDGLGATYRMTMLDVARAIDRPACVRVDLTSVENKEDGK